MNGMNRFLALVIGVLVAGSASADWIEDSDKNAMAVLRSQALFQHRGAGHLHRKIYLKISFEFCSPRTENKLL